MNAPVAENQIVVTKNLFLEGILRISRDGYGKAAAKSMLIFLGMWLALVCWTMYQGGTVTQTLGYLALVGLIGLWICVVLPRSHAKRLWNIQEAKYGSESPRCIRFYEEELIITGDCLEKTVPYEQIISILMSRRLVILVCRDKTGILLSRKGFSGKKQDEIIALIQRANHKE